MPPFYVAQRNLALQAVSVPHPEARGANIENGRSSSRKPDDILFSANHQRNASLGHQEIVADILQSSCVKAAFYYQEHDEPMMEGYFLDTTREQTFTRRLDKLEFIYVFHHHENALSKLSLLDKTMQS